MPLSSKSPYPNYNKTNRTPSMEILSAHPIEPAVREQILAQLHAIEQRHDVTILYACESGSRGWGFASPDSDYDVRFIYMNRLDWYLSVHEQRDVIEIPVDEVLDINGWDLKKALQLLAKSNPTLLEWLDSPIVYRSDEATISRLRQLARTFFAPERGRYHYLSMAKKNFRSYLEGESVRYKKYLYVLRPLLAVRWIDTGLGLPPMRFADLVAGTVKDSHALAEINALLELKMRAGEAEYGPRREHIHQLLEDEFARAEQGPLLPRPEGEQAALDQLFRETVRRGVL